MSNFTNHLGQPVGFPLPDWRPCRPPPRTPMRGRYCIVEPLDPEHHAADLHEANLLDREGRNWTYLGAGPFTELADYRAWMEGYCRDEDPLFHAVLDDVTGRAIGVAAFMRLQPEVGVIEVGNINFSPRLQRTRAATEAMYLMMCRAFDELGYRRYEWKCDSFNEPSERAARRFGFTREGVFRQAVVYKGRNRDTTWLAMIDREWLHLKRAYERWLDPANFNADGNQRERLGDLTSAALAEAARAG